MASRTKYIGYGVTATLIGLIAWFVISSHFAVQLEGDSACAGNYEDPCEWHYNNTLVTISVYYIQNKNSVDINFVPEVKEVFHCKKDGRYRASWRADLSHPNYAELNQSPCGIGWREFDWKTPLTPKYKYIEKFRKGKKHEYKIVVFKFNPSDNIKFGGKITGEDFDPRFLPVHNITIKYEQECETTKEKIKRPTYVICYRNITSTYYDNTTIPVSSYEVFTNLSHSCKDGTYIDIVNTSVCRNVGVEIEGEYGKYKMDYEEEEYRFKLINFTACFESVHDGFGDIDCKPEETYVKIDIRNFSVENSKSKNSIKRMKIEKQK